ncbi:MAG: translesion error-prone DNA polymerase V autoproteolytic subunit [Desulfosudaceae bacterium]
MTDHDPGQGREAGAVFTGFPSPADDFTEERLDLNRLVIRHPQATFFMRATGDALREAGVRAGDILVVDRSLRVVEGCLVVAAARGELVVRRVRRRQGRLCLVSAEERLAPLDCDSETAVIIWGVVTHALRDLRVPGSA